MEKMSLTTFQILLKKNVNNGILCGENWLKKGTILNEYIDCIEKDNEARRLAQDKFGQDIYQTIHRIFFEILLFASKNAKASAPNIIAILEAVFQFGVALMVCGIEEQP